MCAYLIENHHSPGSHLHNIGSGQAVTVQEMAEIVRERAKIQFGFFPKLTISNPSSVVSAGLTYVTTPFACARPKDEWVAISEEIDNLLQFCKLNFG